MKLKRTYLVGISVLLVLVNTLSVPSADVAQQSSYTLLVAGDRDVQVVRITPTGGNIVRTIPTLGDTVALGVAPNGRYAISLNEGNTVSIITGLDGDSPSETALLAVGVSPRALTITEDSETAVVLNAGDDPVSYSVIRGLPDTPEVQTFAFCENQPCRNFSRPEAGIDIDLLPGGSGSALTSVVVSDTGPPYLTNIAVLDGVLSNEPAQVRIVRGQGIRDGFIAVAPDGKTGFVNSLDTIVRITGLRSDETATIVGITEAQAFNGSIRITPDGSMLLAVKGVRNDFTGSVLFYRITLAGLSFLTEVPLEEDVFEDLVTPLAISPDGKVAIVLIAQRDPPTLVSGKIHILRIDTEQPVETGVVGFSPLLTPTPYFGSLVLPQAIAFVPNPTGEPRVTVRESEPNNSIANAQSITPPALVLGAIDSAGDEDVFALNASSGDEIVVQTRAVRLPIPSLADTLVSVEDGAGNILAENDDISGTLDSLVTFMVMSAGRYFVRIRDLRNKGGPNFKYEAVIDLN